jgi:hypothetical protein
MGKDSSDEHDHVAGRALEQGQALQSRARHHTSRARIARRPGGTGDDTYFFGRGHHRLTDP